MQQYPCNCLFARMDETTELVLIVGACMAALVFSFCCYRHKGGGGGGGGCDGDGWDDGGD